MATFNLQNNVVNAFFLKRRRREVNFCAVATLNSYVKRSKTACKMHHHGYVKAAFWCEKSETSSFFKLTTSKNEAILRDFLQKWKVECRADSLVPMRFAIFRLQLSKLLRLPRKSDTGSYEVLHLSRKIISANLKM